jgi:siroheme synthase
MPGPNYGSLQAELRAAGVREEMPCLLISAASGGGNRSYPTTLASLHKIPQLPTPNILVVGEVVRFARREIRDVQGQASWWLERSRLHGGGRQHAQIASPFLLP